VTPEQRLTASLKNKGGRISVEQIIFIKQPKVSKAKVFKFPYFLKL
jgi:hypothetical protein